MPAPELMAPERWACIDFISDLHLQADDPATVAAWRDYLRGSPADALFILGNTQYNSAGFAFYFAFAFCIIALACAIGFERSLANEIDRPQSDGDDINESLIGQSLIVDGTHNHNHT